MPKKYFFANSEPGVDILSLNPIVHSIPSQALKDFMGKNVPEFIYEFSQGTFRAGGIKKQWVDFSKYAYNKLLADPELDNSLVINTKQTADDIYILAKDTLIKIRDKKIDQEQARVLIKKFFYLYFDICVYAITGAIMELSSADSSRGLKDLLTKKLKDKKQVNEYLSILSFRYEETYDQKAQKVLLSIAQKIVDNKLSLSKLSDKIKKEIDQYVFDWSWTRYGYTGPLYTKTNAMEDLKGILSLDILPKQQIKNIDKELKQNQEKRKEYIESLKLSDKERRVVALVGNIAYTKSTRAQMMYMAAFVIHKLLKPFLKKEGITLRQAGMMTMEEMIIYMDSGKMPSVSILNKRWKSCILFDYGDSEKFIYGQEAADWIKKNVELDKIDKNVKILSGQVACPGNTKEISGAVKIVNSPQDMANFHEGDILVSITTTPDIVPAMKRAAAIISDVGGLTCHASIVSRELGKACIIGTKFATKVLSDGEQVELDMEEGIIKRLK